MTDIPMPEKKKNGLKKIGLVLILAILIIALAIIIKPSLLNLLNFNRTEKATQNNQPQNTENQAEKVLQEKVFESTKNIVLEKSVLNFSEQGTTQKEITASDLPAAVASFIPSGAQDVKILTYTEKAGTSFYKIQFFENQNLTESHKWLVTVLKDGGSSQILNSKNTSTFSLMEIVKGGFNIKIEQSYIDGKTQNLIYAQGK